jgi:hypothetical protein
MAADSRESENRICKKTDVQQSKTGKYDYFVQPFQLNPAMASAFFTADEFP